MRKITATIPLSPFGAARTRARAVPTGRFDRNGQRIWTAQVYKQGTYKKWMEAALVYFLQAAPVIPLEGPLELRFVALSECRKGDKRKRTPAGRKWHDTKPDIDNIEKAICDVAEQAGWFKNDSQVCRVVKEQVRAAQGEPPAIKLIVTELEAYRCRGSNAPEGARAGLVRSTESTLPSATVLPLSGSTSGTSIHTSRRSPRRSKKSGTGSGSASRPKSSRKPSGLGECPF